MKPQFIEYFPIKRRIVPIPVPTMTEAEEKLCMEALKAAATEALRKLERKLERRR